MREARRRGLPEPPPPDAPAGETVTPPPPVAEPAPAEHHEEPPPADPPAEEEEEEEASPEALAEPESAPSPPYVPAPSPPPARDEPEAPRSDGPSLGAEARHSREVSAGAGANPATLPWPANAPAQAEQPRPTAAAGPSWLDEAGEVVASDARIAWTQEAPRPEPEDPDPPQGDPLAPPHEPAPDDDPVPEPEDPDPPHGDPLRAIRALDLPTTRSGDGNGDGNGGRELRRELPPLPAETASRRPPRAPRRRRRGGPPPPPPARSSGPPTRRPRRWRGRLAALVAMVGVIAAIVFLVELFQPFHGSGHGTVTVTIPSGANAGDIGDLLAKRGVVAHGTLFSIRASLAGKRGDFQAGTFTLRRGMSYGAAIDALTSKPGTAPTIDVTIPEGRGRRETAPLLARSGVAGDYLRATVSSPLLDPRAYGAPKGTPSLEGFLFPATYQLRRQGASAGTLVADQLKAFKANFAKVDLRTARASNLSRYDVITIASMVEREAEVATDRPLVAAVIYNRLRRGMPLGIDATTRYALDDWSRPLTNADFARSGRFDTRAHTGLPPTPIGNPGLASLEAAAHPARVGYLYYVLKPCAHGAHAFSSTNAQFQHDVASYNAMRSKLGRNPVDC